METIDFCNDLYRNACQLIEAYGVDTECKGYPVMCEDVPYLVEAVTVERLDEV